MAMLAERKRKTKWGVNPQGNLWSNDNTKFGQKLLEKMGWSPGEGLGVQKQGRSEVLRVQYKNDIKGFGFKGNDEDWVKHQDEFNAFLTNLSEQAQTNKDIDPIEVDSGTSLELKSSQSRARIHYHKFTRGKDLSRYSKKDLTAILGTPVKVESTEKQQNYLNKNHINAGSMDEYFKRKLPKTNSVGFDCTDNNNIEKEHRQNEEISLKEDETLDPNSIKKKKKSKKLKLDEINTEEDYNTINKEVSENVENNTICNSEFNEDLEVSNRKNKTKKCKSKNMNVEDIYLKDQSAIREEIQYNVDQEYTNLETSESCVGKKKKKCKKMKVFEHNDGQDLNIVSEQLDSNINESSYIDLNNKEIENSNISCLKIKKKAKHNMVESNHEEIIDTINKHEDCNFINLESSKSNDELNTNYDNVTNIIPKSKKKKKSRSCSIDECNSKNIMSEDVKQIDCETISSQTRQNCNGELDKNTKDLNHITVKRKTKKRKSTIVESEEIETNAIQNVIDEDIGSENYIDFNNVAHKNIEVLNHSGKKKKNKSKFKIETAENIVVNCTQIEQDMETQSLQNDMNVTCLEENLNIEDGESKSGSNKTNSKKRKLDMDNKGVSDDMSNNFTDNEINFKHKQKKSNLGENVEIITSSKPKGEDKIITKKEKSEMKHNNVDTLIGINCNTVKDNDDSIINNYVHKSNLTKYTEYEENDFQSKNEKKQTEMSAVKDYFKRNKLVLSVPELDFKGANINEIEGYGLSRKTDST